MSSLKWIIPIIIVAILVGVGVYTIYRSQSDNVDIGKRSETPDIEGSGFGEVIVSPSPTASPVLSAQAPNSQPATGPEDGPNVKNKGIQITTPATGQLITSPVKVSGTANVTSQTVVIKVKSTDGIILGEGIANACIGLDACPFEASITFDKPATGLGILEIYSPSTTDNSPTYLHTVPVSF